MHVCILCGQHCGCSAVELALHPNAEGCAHRCNLTDDDLPSLRSLFGLFKDAPRSIEHIESGWDDVAILKEIFKQMDPRLAEEIRAAYYDAITSLRTLADALEVADAEEHDSNGPLLQEHYNAALALEAMNHSRLGSVL